YQQILQNLHLPVTQEPDTPRPSPAELTPGFRLRVQWSTGWWKAKVLEVSEDAVKVSYDAWGAGNDEWMPKDSERLHLPLPGDKPAEDQEEFRHMASTATGRAYVPKPFNPEKEFQKRQLRLREKVAAMQK
ncbi:unnamed protein product, partial [Effrenium voratum]